MATVSIRELKNRLSHHLRQLERGEQITVTKRGKPVATITPVPQAEESEQARLRRKLQELQAQGIIAHIGTKPKGLAKPVKLIGEGPTISEMVLEDRG